MVAFLSMPQLVSTKMTMALLVVVLLPQINMLISTMLVAMANLTHTIVVRKYSLLSFLHPWDMVAQDIVSKETVCNPPMVTQMDTATMLSSHHQLIPTLRTSTVESLLLSTVVATTITASTPETVVHRIWDLLQSVMLILLLLLRTWPRSNKVVVVVAMAARFVLLLRFSPQAHPRVVHLSDLNRK